MRSFLRGITLDTVLVFLIAPLFITSIVVDDLFGLFKTFLAEQGQVSGEWLRYSSVGFSVLLSTAMFYLVYRYLPDRRAAPRAGPPPPAPPRAPPWGPP